MTILILGDMISGTNRRNTAISKEGAIDLIHGGVIFGILKIQEDMWLNVVCTCTTIVGTGYVEWGLHFFSCHSSLLRWQEYKAIYLKVRAHYPLSCTM